MKWTCCDPKGVTFCTGCGDDIQRGRTLPHAYLAAPTPAQPRPTRPVVDDAGGAGS